MAGLGIAPSPPVYEAGDLTFCPTRDALEQYQLQQSNQANPDWNTAGSTEHVVVILIERIAWFMSIAMFKPCLIIGWHVPSGFPESDSLTYPD